MNIYAKKITIKVLTITLSYDHSSVILSNGLIIAFAFKVEITKHKVLSCSLEGPLPFPDQHFFFFCTLF